MIAFGLFVAQIVMFILKIANVVLMSWEQAFVPLWIGIALLALKAWLTLFIDQNRRFIKENIEV